MSNAARLVREAQEWAGHYGKYANGPEGAVITAPLRVRAAWDQADDDAFARMFMTNGSFTLGDDTLTSRDEIRDYVKELFVGEADGSRWHEEPLEIRLLAPDVAIAVMQGGVVLADESSLAPQRTHRSVYLVVKQDGDWRILSLQTNTLGG